MLRRAGGRLIWLVLSLAASALFGRFEDSQDHVRRPPPPEPPAVMRRPPPPETAQQSPRRPTLDPLLVAEDEIGPGVDTQGTAFSVDGDGWWLTNEHVVRGCDRFRFTHRAVPRRGIGVVDIHPTADLALVRSGDGTRSLGLADRVPRRGEIAYAAGFPSGERSAVRLRMAGRSEVTDRRRGTRSLGTVWIILDVWGGPFGGGSSGSPVFDASGRVVGIHFAGSGGMRRGRAVSVDIDGADRLVRRRGQAPDVASGIPIAVDDFAATAEDLFDDGRIAHLICFRD